MRRVVLLLPSVLAPPVAHAQDIHNDPGPAGTTLYVHGEPYQELVQRP